jgi:hypothetical protein
MRARAISTAIALLIAIVAAPTIPATAADCTERACIDVYTQDGKIVIEGRKGTGPVVKQTVAPAPRATRKAVVKKPIVKKPIVKRPVVKKPVTKKKVKKAVAPAQSLSDKLIELLPTAGIAYSPSFQPLIRVPVFFWSDLPTQVIKKVEILGEKVDVRLSPTYIWHFGDGTFFATRDVGGPFPDGHIQHTYSRPGHYIIELVTSWDGSFTVNGVTARIPGEIKSVSVLPITVVAAPTRFIQ